MRESAGICRRIGTRGTADRTLIDQYRTGKIFAPGHGLAVHDFVRFVTTLETSLQILVENLIEQRRFSGTRNTSDDIQAAERDIDVHILDVVEIRSADLYRSLIFYPPRLRNRYFFLASQI